MSSLERLEALGLTKCATTLKKELTIRQKLAVAYAHFRYLTPEKLAAFNVKLRTETEQVEGQNQWGQIKAYKRTKQTSLKDYDKVPPDSVLDALEAAQAHGCFDQYEVMTLESHKEVPDPILFGTVEGSPDLFFIAQWDTDVKIEDILNDHEGWKFLEKA